MSFDMILFIFCILRKIGTQDLYYVSLKPLETMCARIDKESCDEDIIKILLTPEDDSTEFDPVSFPRTKSVVSLKNFEGIYAYFEERLGELLSITQETSNGEEDLISVDSIEIDDLLKIFDYEAKIVISFRIKIMKKVDISIDFISLSLSVKSKSLNDIDDPTPDKFGNFFPFEVSEAESNHNQLIYFVHSKYRCIINQETNCKKQFIKKFKFKASNGLVLPHDDNVLNNYLLSGVLLEANFEIHLIYKFHTTPLVQTNHFPEIDQKIFEFPTKNIVDCTYKEENTFLNIECKCKRGYFGIDCQHKLHETKADYQNLNMCGTHGSRKNDTSNRECVCEEGWTGKYCSKIIDKTTPVVAKKSNVKTALAIFFTIVILIVIIIGIFIYLKKYKNLKIDLPKIN